VNAAIAVQLVVNAVKTTRTQNVDARKRWIVIAVVVAENNMPIVTLKLSCPPQFSRGRIFNMNLITKQSLAATSAMMMAMMNLEAKDCFAML
jgi:hypothetical protein